jgi:predicted O-methyltransferase YrrM
VTATSDLRRAAAFLDSLQPDPFEHVRRASDEHREAHAAQLAGGAQECGVYPSDPLKVRVLANIVRAMQAKRILEVGCGLGYSALWLADGAGADSTVETIDRFPEHAALAQGFAKQAALESRMKVFTGDSDTVLSGLSGPYDFVHDDGWFAVRPSHFRRVLELLRAGGVLAMSNWFLLVQSMAEEPNMDWSEFAGPNWRENVQAFARELATERRLEVAWMMDPGVALAVKLA